MVDVISWIHDLWRNMIKRDNKPVANAHIRISTIFSALLKRIVVRWSLIFLFFLIAYNWAVNVISRKQRHSLDRLRYTMCCVFPCQYKLMQMTKRHIKSWAYRQRSDCGFVCFAPMIMERCYSFMNLHVIKSHTMKMDSFNLNRYWQFV